jgi:hypothetical protein
MESVFTFLEDQLPLGSKHILPGVKTLNLWYFLTATPPMIHHNQLPHDITISPIVLARGANQKQVPHDSILTGKQWVRCCSF